MFRINTALPIIAGAAIGTTERGKAVSHIPRGESTDKPALTKSHVGLTRTVLKGVHAGRICATRLDTTGRNFCKGVQRLDVASSTRTGLRRDSVSQTRGHPTSSGNHGFARRDERTRSAGGENISRRATSKRVKRGNDLREVRHTLPLLLGTGCN